jgi:hypothetical protein
MESTSPSQTDDLRLCSLVLRSRFTLLHHEFGDAD